jgi:hypothetical protein
VPVGVDELVMSVTLGRQMHVWVNDAPLRVKEQFIAGLGLFFSRSTHVGDKMHWDDDNNCWCCCMRRYRNRPKNIVGVNIEKSRRRITDKIPPYVSSIEQHARQV